MTSPFERIPQVPEADEVVDSSFAKASRVAETASGVESQRGMTARAGERISSRLRHVVEGFPSFDGLEGFYDAVARAAVDVDEVRRSLASVDWAASQVEKVGSEVQREMDDDVENAIAARKRAFARMSSVVDEVDEDLERLREARERLVGLPEVRDLPTAVLAGMPNVGKSSLLAALTRASPEVDDYSFTTKSVDLGHIEDRHATYQVVDTPGLLDRPREERNEMEQQAVEALGHLADVVVYVVDPSETCGYSLDSQLDLLDDVRSLDVSVLVVSNKTDLDDVYDEADLAVSKDDVDALRERLVEVLRESRPKP
ncbi:MAG: NOG1 family protein [Halobacteriota archaeon]